MLLEKRRGRRGGLGDLEDGLGTTYGAQVRRLGPRRVLQGQGEVAISGVPD
jgi:hypothetical protein